MGRFSGGEGEAATRDDVTPLLAADIRALMEFFERHNRAMRRILGGRARNVALMASLMRTLVLAAAEGKRLSVKDCQERCREHGSPSSVAVYIAHLEAVGCVILGVGDDRRRRIVAPTRKLVRFYAGALDELMRGALAYYKKRAVKAAASTRR